MSQVKMSILNDTILKNLKCSVCEKYLSVLPIKVYPNHKVICGRCCGENDGGTVSIYNRVAKNCLFKCINRYEKCNKLLAVSEVVEHEKKCISGNYHCPKCEYKFSGSAYQLVQHYRSQHPKSVIKNGYFSIKVKLNLKDTFLYIINDNIFFVLVDNLAKNNILYLSTVSLIMCKNVRQWFSVKPLHKTAKSTVTEIKPCHPLEHFKCDYDYITVPTNSMNEINCRIYLDLSEDINRVHQISVIPNNLELQASEIKNDILNSSISKTDEDIEQQPQKNILVSTDIQTTPLSDILGVKLTDEFKKEHPGYKLTPCGTALFKDNHRIELACSNCKQLTGCNVFSCQLGKHIVCWDCKAWCGICNTSTNGWDVDTANMNELLLLPCKWQCGQHFSGNRITQHEVSCEKCKYKCPLGVVRHT